MKFFFPDSQDQIDPCFDFQTETRSPFRVRQRDDLYAHEVLNDIVYDGLLISMAMVNGTGLTSASYTQANRQRLMRMGVRRFYRLDKVPGPRIKTMGDCGAFSYVKEEKPPYKVEDVIAFYEDCGFDLGVSVDHVILGYQEDGQEPSAEWQNRQKITLKLADDFLALHQKKQSSFTPIGVAQGWSPSSYAHSVEVLQKIGYSRIGLGGMVPLKTHEILSCLESISKILKENVQLHIFGVSRFDHLVDFADHGVTSIDSTSAFRQAFKDDKNNYHTKQGNYLAIRVPQVDGNPKLKRRIKAGEIEQALALELERTCLQRLRAFDQGKEKLEAVVDALRTYEQLYDGKVDRSAKYARVLEDKPWKDCSCAICSDVGIEVIIFRGLERNKRRGFHNLNVFHEKLMGIPNPPWLTDVDETRRQHVHI